MIRRQRHDAPHQADPALYKIVSILLQYPDERVLARLDDVTAAIPAITDASARAAVARFTGWLAAATALDAAQHYVETFDNTRRRGLHLTYYRYGDTRKRGMALLSLNHIYRSAGYPAPDGELPDFLPLVLEFAALAPEPGQRMLHQCRAGLELLGDALRQVGTPYAGLVDAIRAGLPRLAQSERDTLRTLAKEGPPEEQVGLEPFAPPEYLSGGRR
jgi:nitrate reductase delta subunit